VQLLLNRSADQIAERKDTIVDDAVMDVVAGFPPTDDSGIGQDGEMLRDVLLRGIERLREVGHGRFALAKAIEQPNTHRLADDAEPPCDQLDQIAGQGVRKGHKLLLFNYTVV
jgi:hypothetical protein